MTRVLTRTGQVSRQGKGSGRRCGAKDWALGVAVLKSIREDEECLTADAISVATGVSPQRIRQVEADALKKLRMNPAATGALQEFMSAYRDVA